MINQIFAPKRAIVLYVLLLVCNFLFAQTWRWYPGDLDIWMGNRMNALRNQNGSRYPPFWHSYTHYQTVRFNRYVDLAEPEEIEIAVEGQYGVRIDESFQFGMPSRITIPAGQHLVSFMVTGVDVVPAIWIKGKTIVSDEKWMVSTLSHEEPSDTWFGMDGKPVFDSVEKRPSKYHLSISAMEPVEAREDKGDLFFAWEKEETGYLKLNGVEGNGQVNLYYGESPDEALSRTQAYTCDKVVFSSDSVLDLASLTCSPRISDSYRLVHAQAMRYVLVECTGGVKVKGVTLMSEMKDLGEVKGSFECSDTLLNHIWQVGLHTLHLTDREVMIEGIKRDRWTWSGDAIQSYLMNYYAFMDAPAVKSTIWSLRGKDPVEQHVNTILDYTFYWFNSVYDYYLYTGDEHFLRQIYPRMQTLMQYVEGRLNSHGMVEGMPGDWVFVDWSPRGMSKEGALSFEQVAFCRSLQAMCQCADIVGNKEDLAKYEKMKNRIADQLTSLFWDAQRGLYVHSVVDGKQSQEVTRYGNMFAVLYDYSTPEQNEQILRNVLLSDSVMEITTPYMRFYELETLCKLGEQKRVMEEIRNYWGGMLAQGATTFWETYDPKEGYPDRLHMYGIPFGKSLCHAWGASPLYLLGKYYLGVRPLAPGYEKWECAPCLGDLQWMKGDVPTPKGKIHVEMTSRQITLHGEGCGEGQLLFRSKSRPTATEGTIESLGENRYRLLIPAEKEIKVKYKSYE